MLKRIGFRFLFVYFILWNLPFPLNELPGTWYFSWKYTQAWHWIATQAASHILHPSAPLSFVEHSGDIPYRYILFLCQLILALLAAVLWSAFDAGRTDDEELHDWLRLYLRLALAAPMIGYGAFKVIQAQFPPPRLSRLLETFGDSSPMGLLWTFMGFSPGYNLFTGLVETAGGVLLVIPSLTTLGALVSAAAMTNVLMLNLCYDVPVKLKSFHLLAMAAILIAPDLRRLADLLVFNRPVEPAPERPLFWRKDHAAVALVLQLVFGVYLLRQSLQNARQNARSWNEQIAKTPLYGIWNVDEFSCGAKADQTEELISARWRRLVFDYPNALSVRTAGGGSLAFGLKVDPEKRTLALEKFGAPSSKSELSFAKPAPNALTLEGLFEGRRLRARLHRFDESQFTLLSRGFHWVSENPFNR